MKSKLFLFSLFTTALVQAQSWKAVEGRIMSQWAKEVNPENVWQEYPRPQFERAQWKNLNGLWDYAILKTNQIQPKRFQGKILVPFSFESPLSGVGKNISPEDKMWYKKSFTLSKNWKEKDVILHFEAVDYQCAVWVNDILVGTQMVTKGLDFRHVKLVGVLNADQLINFPDFRAHERSFQLLQQVAGRAGRTDTRGKVVVQTYNPYHTILQQVQYIHLSFHTIQLFFCMEVCLFLV